MTTPQEPLTHSVDIDLVGVTKLKSVTPEPSDQGVINGETSIFRFRVRDGERITLDTGRRQVEVVVNPRAGASFPGLGPEARDEAAELRAALREFFKAEAAVAALYHPNGIYTDFYEAADIANAARENLRRLAASEGQP